MSRLHKTHPELYAKIVKTARRVIFDETWDNMWEAPKTAETALLEVIERCVKKGLLQPAPTTEPGEA